MVRGWSGPSGQGRWGRVEGLGRRVEISEGTRRQTGAGEIDVVVAVVAIVFLAGRSASAILSWEGHRVMQIRLLLLLLAGWQRVGVLRQVRIASVHVLIRV